MPPCSSFILPLAGYSILLAYSPAFPRGDYSTLTGMTATFKEIDWWNQHSDHLIRSVVCPGFGTYTGMCPEDVLQVVQEMGQALRGWKNR